MKSLRSYKLKAGSLIESVIAIAIISICLFMATMTYVKLLDSDYDIAYYKAKQKVSELHLQTIEEKLFEDEIYDFESYQISKMIIEENNLLKQVKFTVRSKNKTEVFMYLVKSNALEDE